MGARCPTEAYAVGGVAEIEQDSTTESQSVWPRAGMEEGRDSDISRGGARKRASSRSREYRRHQRTPRSRAGRIRSCAGSLALALGASKKSAARHPAIRQTALPDDQVRERNARAVAQSTRTLRRTPARTARQLPERRPPAPLRQQCREAARGAPWWVPSVRASRRRRRGPGRWRRPGAGRV